MCALCSLTIQVRSYPSVFNSTDIYKDHSIFNHLTQLMFLLKCLYLIFTSHHRGLNSIITNINRRWPLGINAIIHHNTYYVQNKSKMMHIHAWNKITDKKVYFNLNNKLIIYNHLTYQHQHTTEKFLNLLDTPCYKIFQ